MSKFLYLEKNLQKQPASAAVVQQLKNIQMQNLHIDRYVDKYVDRFTYR
jgi:hypothetical protein